MDQMEKRKQPNLEDQLPATKAIRAASLHLASTADPTPVTKATQQDLSGSCPAPDNPAVILKWLRLLVASLQESGITQLNATLFT